MRRPLSLEALETRETPALIGALDPSFGTNGVFVDSTLVATDSYLAVAQTPDGAYIAVGSAGNKLLVTKLLQNGSVDPTFGRKTFDSAAAGNTASGVVVKADGTIIVVGTELIGGDTDAVVLKLDASGNQLARDTRNVAAGANDTANGVAVNPTTGDIYVVGTTTNVNDYFVYRLNSNLAIQGTIVTDTFGLGGVDQGWGVALDSTGRVYVVGNTSGGAGGNDVGVARYNADLTGRIRQTYNLGGNDLAFAIAVNKTTGDVYVDGRTSVNGTDDFAVLRLDANLGATPLAKAVLPIANVDRASSIALDARGRVIAAGRSDANFAVARLDANTLAPDTTFRPNGVAVITLPAAAGSNGTGVVVDHTSGRIVEVGAAGVSPAAVRLIGGVELPGPVAVGGNTSGGVPVFRADNGTSYTTPAVATLTPIGGTAVNSVLADVNGDGVADLISGANAGSDRVVVLDGRDPTGLTVLASFSGIGGGYAGGVFVAAGDLNNDGKAEVVVSPVLGGRGPEVVVYGGASLTGGTTSPTRLADFNGIADALTGAADNTPGTIANVGARVAVGDVNGDGVADIAVAAGLNGGPRVTIWDGKNVAAAAGGTPAAPPLANAFVFEATQRDGAFITLGDVTNDGKADLIAGGGPNGGPRVRIGDMAAILAAKNFGAFDAQLGVVKSNFFAGDPNTRGGIRVAARDVDGDGIADLVTASGSGLPSQVQLFKGTKLVTFTSGTQSGDQQFDPFSATLANGVFVG